MSKGSIDLELEKTTFKPGQSVIGKVTLDLKKPTKAKELYVTLVGVEDPEDKKAERVLVHFDFQQLGGTGVYPAKKTSTMFQMDIPKDVFKNDEINPKAKPDEKPEDAAYFRSTRTTWSLEVRLKKIRWGKDIAKKVPINIA